VLADSPEGHMTGTETSPWQAGMPQGQPMTPEQMEAMRQQRMQMMQGGPAMQGGPGTRHQGGMMPPMMKRMMEKRDQHWQQVEQRLANIEALLQQLVDLQKK
jgi:hypothetical protein